MSCFVHWKCDVCGTVSPATEGVPEDGPPSGWIYTEAITSTGSDSAALRAIVCSSPCAVKFFQTVSTRCIGCPTGIFLSAEERKKR